MKYPNTRWSLVGCLDAKDQETRQRAWSWLVEAYRPALNAYARNLVRQKGGGVLSPSDAEDLVSSFVATCYHKDDLSNFDPKLGSFRNFVRVLMRRHLMSMLRHASAKKRRPEGGLADIDQAFQLPDDGTDAADEVLAKEWSDCILASALERVRKRSERNAICIEAMRDRPDIDNEELATRLGLPADRVAVIRHRARRMLASAIYELMDDTVHDDEQLAEERRRLRPYLGTWTGEKRPKAGKS